MLEIDSCEDFIRCWDYKGNENDEDVADEKKRLKKAKKLLDILCSNDYYITMLISQRRNNMEKTNINALSNIWKEWCEANNIPKHDNGQHYSADDIIFDYCQVMPFCPNEKQSAFISAFKEVWIQTIQH